MRGLSPSCQGLFASLEVPLWEHFYDTMTVRESQDKRKFQTSLPALRMSNFRLWRKNIRQLPDRYPVSALFLRACKCSYSME